MTDTTDVVLITVSGQDKPGLIAMLTSTLAEYQVRILDIGASVIHDEMNLGLFVELVEGRVDAPVLKELLFRTHQTGVRVRFQPISRADYDAWVTDLHQPRYMVTLLDAGIDAGHLAAVTQVLVERGMNIEAVRRLTSRVPLEEVPADRRASIELSVSGGDGDETALKEGVFAAAQLRDFDFSVQRESVYRRHRRLVAFDMDSTLIQAEVIDELARSHGVGDEVAEVTGLAMSGELDFKESLVRRVGLLAGLEEAVLREITEDIALTEGADRLVGAVKHLGLKTAIISGGFDYVGRRLQAELGIDYVYTNNLEVADGRLTGRVVGEIIDAQRKAEILREICAREDISALQSIAVGDGANDLPMLATAGLGVAFHAKPVVRESASHSISNFGLDSVLYLLGFSDRDLDQLGKGE